MKRLRIALRNTLGICCLSLSEFFLECSRRLICCTHCGRSRFYGESCTRGWQQQQEDA